MKNLINIFILVALLMLTGCEKEDSIPKCESQKYGTLAVHNVSSNPYDISVDGTFRMTINGNSWGDAMIIPEGNDIQLFAKQVSGYFLFPTTREANFNVVRCSDYQWEIP